MSRTCTSILVLALAFGMLSGCEKMSLLSPTGSTITLTINKTVLPINGTAEVTAAVIESAGTPVQNGTVVVFTSSFGIIEPREARTEGGIARVTFTGTQSGTAKIGAFSGGARVDAAAELEVKVGGAAAATIAMRSNPAALPQGGGTVDVLATVRDASGTLLPGAPVSFTTDQGNLGSTAAITDANGEASTTLTTNRDAIVTATVISGVTATTNVRIISAPTVTIALASGSTPSVGVGTNFTITPGASINGATIQSVTVDFGDGTPVQNLGAISGATNVTHAFTNPGSYTVTASVIDATGQRTSSSISITVQRIAPTVTLTPASSSITTGTALAFSVTAASGTGGPPVQNVRVTINPGGTQLYSGSGSGSFTHQFVAPGVYTLTATATDTAGTVGTAAAVVTVAGFEVNLDASGAGLTCAGTTYPKTCTGLAAGTNVTFTATVAAAGVSVVSYQWTWGDGSPAETTTARFNSHVYTASGNLQAFVTVTTSSGATATGTVFLRP